jgi:signal transduction histidine kinase
MNSKLAAFYQNFYQTALHTGDNYLEVLPGRLHKRWIKNHKQVLQGEKVTLTKRFKIQNYYLWFEIFCFPIVEADGEISGVAYMAREITERIKNEQLILKYIKKHNALKLKQEKLKMLGILQGQEEERRKISMELHDGVGQLQTALMYKMNKLTDKILQFNHSAISNLAAEITHLQKDIYQEIRRISEHLMPQYLNDFPLDKALTQLLMISFKNTDIQPEQDIKLESASLSKNLEVAVFRITQEIINNVLKHAQASHFNIKLYNSRHYLQLQIEDNGIGFHIPSLQEKRGKGLTNIKERINLLNGSFSIHTSPGKGCLIEIKIPIF